jgi:hypothetical protein
VAFRPEDPNRMMLFHTDWGISVTPDGTVWLGTDHGTFKLVSSRDH